MNKVKRAIKYLVQKIKGDTEEPIILIGTIQVNPSVDGYSHDSDQQLKEI